MAKLLLAICIFAAYSTSSLGAGDPGDAPRQTQPSNPTVTGLPNQASEMSQPAATSGGGGGFLGDILKNVSPPPSSVFDSIDSLDHAQGSGKPEVTGMPVTAVPKCCLPKK